MLITFWFWFYIVVIGEDDADLGDNFVEPTNQVLTDFFSWLVTVHIYQAF